MENENSEVKASSKFSIKLIYIAVAVFVLVGIGVFYFYLKFKPNSNVDISKSYSIDEVSKHSDKNSCWMVIDNNVYDVTKFIPSHQGGDQILMGCGKDATELFKNNEKHGFKADKMLQGLQIGILAGS